MNATDEAGIWTQLSDTRYAINTTTKTKTFFFSSNSNGTYQTCPEGRQPKKEKKKRCGRKCIENK